MQSSEKAARWEAEDRERQFREDIRLSCDWIEVLQFAQIDHPVRVKPEGKFDLHCVFHEERTPSLRLWPDGGFLCHGCGETGDMLDFIRRLMPGIYDDEIIDGLGNLRFRVTDRSFENRLPSQRTDQANQLTMV